MLRPKSSKPAGKSSGASVGVDILNPNKVARLFEHSPEKTLQNLFTPLERKYVVGASKIARAARLLTAKEAFFKALNASWLGPDGFKNIEVKCLPGARFHVKSLDSEVVEAEGCFFEREHLVGAQVILWNSSCAG